MDYLSGKLATTLILAVLLSCIAAWVIAYRYRRVMQRLMRVPVAAGGTVGTGAVPAENLTQPAPAPVSFVDNRRAGLRLALVLIGLSCLVAMTSASLWMWLAFPNEPFMPKRTAAVALLYVWPVIPTLGLMWRWSGWRILFTLLLWCVFCFLVLLWRSIEPRPLELLRGMSIEILPTLLLVALIFLGGATRAVAPWLLLPFAGLVWSSILGLELFEMLVRTRSPLLMWFPTWLIPVGVMALFALLPWLLAWWPLYRFGRALGRAYSRKWLSELMVAFTTVWALVLLGQVIVRADSGWVALSLFLPLLWIPLVMLIYRKWHARQGRPPTLLVLRVFQHDAAVQDLFDHVIERWRLSGNTVMIAGTDLADRTLDAADIFTFLDRKLAQRFIQTPADVAPRIATFDMTPDADGRYRVNECYCHDTTWQQALHALVERSDVVLMDLRGFKAHNAGCRFELGTLAKAARPLHVVVLTDAATDREAAAQSIIGGRAERFVWLDATRVDARKRKEVLASLFASQPTGDKRHNSALRATG